MGQSPATCTSLRKVPASQGGKPVSRKPLLAAALSLLAPGLGQIYAGRGTRGAAILFASIVIGSLHIIWLSLHAGNMAGEQAFWASTLPRIVHDVLAAWSLVFWAWAVVDAYRQAKDPRPQN